MSKPFTQFLAAFKSHLDLTVETKWGDPDDSYRDEIEEDSIEDSAEYIEKVVYDSIADIPFDLNFTIHNGASKIVIVFEQFDWVIKLPFTGSWNWIKSKYPFSFRSFMKENPDKTTEDYLQEKEEWDDSDPGCYEFNYFSGGGHKDNYGHYINDWDYCDTEVDCYNKAKQDGCGELFLPCKYVGKAINGFPIYIQKKGTTFYNTDELPSHNSLATAQHMSKNLRLPFKKEWIAACVDLYGEERTLNVLNYLRREHFIDDMHTENYGFDSKKRPILIDYSNFNG